MAFEKVTLRIEESIAHLQLNRPQANNAIDAQVAQELRAAALELQNRADVRAILLTGAGKNFCVGGDLKDFAKNAPDIRANRARVVLSDLHGAIALVCEQGAPFIAAVHGAVAGAGLSLAAAADITIAASDARFTLAYNGVALTPDAGSTYFLPKLVGYKRALELTLTNRLFSAQEAYEYGLVSRLVAAEDLSAQALELARQLAKGPTETFRATKRLFREGWDNGLGTQLDHEARAFAQAMGTHDTNEGLRAFIEKRTPEYRGN
jgi:2-(1,2-epoxy-1,2-dihydrophenyl)acetyl-CoA isomerase